MLIGLTHVIVYCCFAATTALLLRFFAKIPDEVFRKILHGILLGILFVVVHVFPGWKEAALGCIVFAITVYPILMLAERIKGFSKLLTERKQGELKNSLLLVFSMFAIVIAVCWGFFGDTYLVMAAVSAWGFGDAAAALIGKKYGKRILYKKKSVEGSLAMFVVSFFSVAILLFLRGGLSWSEMGTTAFVVALASTIIELFTENGMDTITCPLGAMFVMLVCLSAFGGL